MFGKETTPQNMRANSETIRKICRTGRIGFGGTVTLPFDNFYAILMHWYFADVLMLSRWV